VPALTHFYDFYAPFYDLVDRPLRAGRKRSLGLLAAKSGERVLIIGAGTGLDLPHLPAGIQISAIDGSTGMLARLRRRTRRLGLTVDAHVMDARRLDFPDGTFDAVVLHLILAVVDDPQRCAAEAARVLRPGGRAVIFDKFLPPGATPSPLRRWADSLLRRFATSLNRDLAAILQGSGLKLKHSETVLFRNNYVAGLAHKT